jgi:hypothetical protein
MSMNQTMASGDQLTLLCLAGGESVTRRQADSWLRQRQAAQTATTSQQQRYAS